MQLEGPCENALLKQQVADLQTFRTGAEKEVGEAIVYLRRKAGPSDPTQEDCIMDAAATAVRVIEALHYEVEDLRGKLAEAEASISLADEVVKQYTGDFRTPDNPHSNYVALALMTLRRRAELTESRLKIAREAVEKAPHTEDCPMNTSRGVWLATYYLYKGQIKTRTPSCDCWKAAALSAIDARRSLKCRRKAAQQ